MGRWLITGASGFLGSHIFAFSTGQEVFTIGRGAPSGTHLTADLADQDAIKAAFLQVKPSHVLHLAAIGDVATCNAEPVYSQAVNVLSTQTLARLCAEHACRMIYASTDMVFDGEHPPYDEDSECRPINSYGSQKHAAEQFLSPTDGNYLVVRLPLMFGIGRSEKKGISYRLLQQTSEGKNVHLFVDEYRTPLWVNDAAKAIISLAQNDTTGIIHLPGPVRLSRYELGLRMTRAAGFDPSLILPQHRSEIAIANERPRDVSLQSKKAVLLGFSPTPMDKAMEQLVAEFDEARKQQG